MVSAIDDPKESIRLPEWDTLTVRGARLRAFELVHVANIDTAVCSGSPRSYMSAPFNILSLIVITITPRDTAPPLLEDVRRVKPCTCFEATERA